MTAQPCTGFGSLFSQHFKRYAPRRLRGAGAVWGGSARPTRACHVGPAVIVVVVVSVTVVATVVGIFISQICAAGQRRDGSVPPIASRLLCCMVGVHG
jgi:hypothetical protein